MGGKSVRMTTNTNGVIMVRVPFVFYVLANETAYAAVHRRQMCRPDKMAL
jgi:hypothetical protein